MRRSFAIPLLLAMVVPALTIGNTTAYRDARMSGALVRMDIHVMDDLGCNVSNAEVSVFMGMNFRPKGYYLNGVTDTNGICLVEGKTCGDEIVINVVKQGYYSSVRKLCFAKKGAERDVENGKWLPFGKNEDIVLRRIVKPIELIAFDKLIDMPNTNIWLGFDMEKMGFVRPFGHGDNVDFEIWAGWDGLPAWESRYCCAEIRFPKDRTGGYYVENVFESTFPYVYAADYDSAYAEKTIGIVDRNGNPHSTKIPFANNTASMVIRTRCVVDEGGEIKVANYGCIRRFEIGPSRRGVALLRLSYVFNPRPNDTNLEPKK